MADSTHYFSHRLPTQSTTYSANPATLTTFSADHRSNPLLIPPTSLKSLLFPVISLVTLSLITIPSNSVHTTAARSIASSWGELLADEEYCQW